MSHQYRIHKIAVVFALIGATIGLAASCYAWITRGEIATGTIGGSIFALTAAVPVLRECLALPTEK